MDIQTIYYLVATVAFLITITGAIFAIYKRGSSRTIVQSSEKKTTKRESKEQIACDYCQRVFTPKLKYREGLFTEEEYTVCPHCGEENVFEVDEEEDGD